MRIKADLRDNVQSSHVDKVFVDRWSIGSSLCKQSVQAFIISSNSHTFMASTAHTGHVLVERLESPVAEKNMMKYPALPGCGAAPDTTKIIPKSL